MYVESYNYDYKEKSSGKSFTVKAAQFSSVKLSKTSYTYTGKAIKPTVTAYVGGSKISSSNYTVTYKNNKNVGTATVTVKGKGIYSSCKKSVTFKIKPKAFTKVKLSKTSYTYNGSAKKPTVTVYVGEKKLASKYYSVSYKNNKNAGTATVTITGKSTYANYKSTKNFKIKPKAFTKVTLSAKQLTYNGKARKVTVKVYSGKTKLSSSYYTVSYKNNKNIGTATVTITGKDKYKNYKSSKTFKIIPAKQSISSLTTKGEKGMIYCTNKKDAKCDGYQVQGSTVSTFKTINIEGPVTSNSWYVQNLPSGKKYYIRVRSYKVVDGKKWYGPWSDVKSIKTK